MRLLKLAFGFGVFGAICACAPEAPVVSSMAPVVEEGQPNILFIVVDDLGFSDLGAFGSEIPTPNIDRLAFEGVRLTNLHAAANCQMSRIMWMASTSNANGFDSYPRDVERPPGTRAGHLSLGWATIAPLLQDAGYQTFMAGKWDLGGLEHAPARRGFDRSFALLGASADYFGTNQRPVAYEDDGRLISLDELPDDFYTTNYFTDKTLEYLQASDPDSPWFAYLSFNSVHWPLMLPDDWLDRYAGRYDDGYDILREQRVGRASELGVVPAGLSLDSFVPVAEPWDQLSEGEQERYSRAQEIYAGLLEHTDMNVGRVIDYLEETGQLENTVVMLMSDHGGSAAESGVTTGRTPSIEQIRGLDPSEVDNSLENFGRADSFIDHGIGFGEAASAPFRQFKATLSEGGLTAAALVRYPGVVPAGEVSDTFLTVMDILPTFLEIAGTEHPGAGEYRGRFIHGILGRSFLSMLVDQTETVHPPTESFGWYRGGRGGAVIRGDYKLINDIELGSEAGPGQAPAGAPWRLYNLATDRGETNDLALDLPDLTAELAAEWEAIWRGRE